jgi:metallo-beta-lactamase family protein
MRIRFLGPIGRVTGSCYWLQDDERGIEFLVDCGMVQDEPAAATWNEGVFPFDPAKLAFVLLTHAHIDHCGLLPLLAQKGFNKRVYCTKETAQLANEVLLDAAKHSAGFSKKDVARLKWYEPPKGAFDTVHPLARDLFFSMFRSGHILGAVSIQVLWGPKGPGQRRITFSGDVGPNFEKREASPLIRHVAHPIPANYAVMESTYGDRVRPPEEGNPEARLTRMASLIDRAVLERRGALLLPAFAIDRTQALLFDLAMLVARWPGKYEKVPLIFDAGLAARANAIYRDGLTRTGITGRQKVRLLWLGKQVFRQLGLEKDSPTSHKQVEGLIGDVLSIAPRKWSGEKPAIILTGGGMCDGGTVLAYLEPVLRDENNTLALSGYASPSTLGGKLARLAQVPRSQRALLSDDLCWDQWGQTKRLPQREIKAEIVQLRGYSGHADQTGLLEWVFREADQECRCAPVAQRVFITHGQDQSRAALAEKSLTEAGGFPPEGGSRLKSLCRITRTAGTTWILIAGPRRTQASCR